MRFESAQLLWLLLVLPPALIVFLLWAWGRKQKLLTEFIEARLLSSLTVGISPVRRKWHGALLMASVVCLIFTLARLQWGFGWEETRQRGLDIVVAIDVSKSMLADDIAPNRLARAKLAALDLMQQAKSDRLGLVAFAGTAFLQCPLTVDDAAFRQSLDALDVNIIPQGGTAVAEAITTALGAFKEADNHKVLVIMTDGEDHEPGAVEAASQAAKAGMRIFTLGIGTPEGELLRLKDAKDRTDYIKDEDGNVVKSHLNEKLLQEIAAAAEGFYLPLRGAKAIDTLYERGLAPLPKTESATKLVKRYHERFYWPLLAGILFLLLETLSPERKRVAKARATLAASETASLRRAIAVFLLLAVPLAAGASSSKALRDYRAGNYDSALKGYQQLLERKADDPRLQFNAGAAAYRDGQFDEAAKRFGQALTAPDLKLQQHAYYNLGNTLYQLGKRLPAPDKKIEAWEKSLKDFERTLKLDPKDEDARYNHEFVRKQLEELKQQPPQPQQNKDDEKNQQPQDQQPEPQNQKDPQKDQKDQEQQQAQQNQPQQNPAQQPDPQQKQQDSQQSQASKQSDDRKRQPAAQPEDQQSKETQEAQAAPLRPGQMSPQRARQLLDAQKSEEGVLLLQQKDAKPLPNRRFKDW